MPHKDVTQAVLDDPEAFIGRYLEVTYDDPNADHGESGGSGLISFVRYERGIKLYALLETDYGYGFPLRPHLKPVGKGLKTGRLRSIVEHPTDHEMIAWLLRSIASWTNARFDQHLRNEFGDADAERALDWLRTFGVLHHVENGGRR